MVGRRAANTRIRAGLSIGKVRVKHEFRLCRSV